MPKKEGRCGMNGIYFEKYTQIKMQKGLILKANMTWSLYGFGIFSIKNSELWCKICNLQQVCYIDIGMLVYFFRIHFGNCLHIASSFCPGIRAIFI